MREYETIVRRIASERPRNILDWGCGWGQITKMLGDAGLDVTAFDYRPEKATDDHQALEKYPEVEAYISSDPVKLPYEDSSFDAVLSCGVLEHVSDPDASLEEIKRVLRPGGTFYVYKLPNRHSYLEAIARPAGIYYHGRDPFDRLYTKRSALSIMDRHGFTVREIRRTNMLPLTLSGKAATRGAGAIWRTNRALSHVPGINALATNVELVATSPQ